MLEATQELAPGRIATLQKLRIAVLPLVSRTRELDNTHWPHLKGLLGERGFKAFSQLGHIQRAADRYGHDFFVVPHRDWMIMTRPVRRSGEPERVKMDFLLKKDFRKLQR
jgi:hypothetical protein